MKEHDFYQGTHLYWLLSLGVSSLSGGDHFIFSEFLFHHLETEKKNIYELRFLTKKIVYFSLFNYQTCLRSPPPVIAWWARLSLSSTKENSRTTADGLRISKSALHSFIQFLLLGGRSRPAGYKGQWKTA